MSKLLLECFETSLVISRVKLECYYFWISGNIYAFVVCFLFSSCFILYLLWNFIYHKFRLRFFYVFMTSLTNHQNTCKLSTILYLLSIYIYIYIYINRLIDLIGRVFGNGLGDVGSIPARVIPKTLKMVLDTSWFNT